MVHLKTGDCPVETITVAVAESGLRMVALPLAILHWPVPIVGVLPVTVKVSVPPHLLILLPALA